MKEKVIYLTGKKEVGIATSNCNDEAVINNIVNEDIHEGVQLLDSYSQPNRY